MEEFSSTYIIKSLFKSLFFLDKKSKIKLILSIFVMLLGVACGAIAPLILRELVNNLGNEDLGFFLILILCFSNSITWTLNQISSTISWLLIQKNIEKMCINYCEEIFFKTISSDYETFVTNNLKSSTTEIEKMFNSLPLIFSNIFIYVIPSISDLITAFLLFFYLYGFLYAIGLIFLFSIFIFLSIFGMRSVNKLDFSYRKKNEEFLSYTNNIFNNFEVIKAFSTENFEKNNLKKLLINFEAVSDKRIMILDGIQILQTISCGLSIFIFSTIAIFFVKKKILLAGDFVLINSYLIQFMTPLTFLGYVFSEVYRGISNLKSAFKLKNIEIEDPINLPCINIEDGEIEFKNVYFERNLKGKILNNISLKIESKQSVAFVGESGSGKSTLMRLILKFLNPTEGKIFIDKHDISQINQKCLRKDISFVPQESLIFPGTLKENILYGIPQESIREKDLKKIISMTSLDKFSSNFFNGLNTSLEGIQISGGEKQRISIARALTRNPKICIFDEPTSALDSTTKTEIKEIFENIFGKLTILLVTHDLSLIENFDLIVVLKNGKIIETGTHKELIRNKNYYFNLIKNL